MNPTERQHRYLVERRDKAKDYLGATCVRCSSGEDLHFHHRDGETKVIEVSVAIARHWSWQRLISELDKCELLCGTCHRGEHASTYSCGTVQRYWRGCKCDDCRAANAAYKKSRIKHA